VDSSKTGSIKRGRTRLNLSNERKPKVIFGVFADSSPSKNRGQIHFHRLQKEEVKKFKSLTQ
jgi:hypothetical protein